MKPRGQRGRTLPQLEGRGQENQISLRRFRQHKYTNKERSKPQRSGQRNHSPRTVTGTPPGAKTPQACRQAGRQTSAPRRGRRTKTTAPSQTPTPREPTPLTPHRPKTKYADKERSPSLRPGRYTLTTRTRTGTPPRVKTPDPSPTPTPLEPTPRSPHLPQPKRASREGGRPSEEILETPDVLVLK